MTDSYVLVLVLIPVLVYWLSRKPHTSSEVLLDYIVPHGVEVRSCATHWGVPAGVARFNRALLSEVRCHPDYVERDVPESWFKWSRADARKRARKRLVHNDTDGVLPIRKQA
jgi:hypothetical protein